MPDYRVTHRGHSTYHTRTNCWRKVRTPGNRLSTLRTIKKELAPKCAATGVKLQGLQRINQRLVSKNSRTVSRAYGGKFTMETVREKILRAFLCEESKAAKV